MDLNKSTTPVWFITGCSSGFGRALAERVLRHGHRCIATARNPEQILDLARAYPDTSMTLALDVTDDKQRRDAVARAEEAFGSTDVLVNNAGHGYSAAIEEGEECDIREMFDTNFFALAALTRLVLPGMRSRGRGHIVNISSVGGLVGNPASGYYSATKFAVEGLSQALAKEVAPLGIRVTLIEPGPFRTDFQGRSMNAVTHPIDAYARTAGVRRAQLRDNSGKQAGDPARAADAIIKVVEAADPPLHLVLGKIGIQRVREELRGVLRSIDAWESISIGTDFPES
jgi:NAD(P)-dependent dehydrogenase (short-subunit alcohol dehydrogenase family)